jgi:hypothetical protein
MPERPEESRGDTTVMDEAARQDATFAAAEAVMDEAARQDATFAAAEAPLP